MQAGLRDPSSFKKTLGVSVIAHIALIAAIALLHRPDNRHFITPVYTMVDIVEHSRAGGPVTRPAPTAAAAPPTPAKTVVKAPQAKEGRHKKTVTLSKSKTTAKADVKTAAPSKTAKVKAAAKEADVDLALKRIKESVRKKADDELVASRIEDIKKAREGEAASKTSAAVEDIRKRIASSGTDTAKQTPATAGSGAESVISGNGPSVSRETLETRFHAYYALIRDTVQENWKYPYKDDKVIIIVSIKIFKDGRLISSEIEQSSGNALFDESLLSAIKKSSPFAPLPQGFPNGYLEAELRFCPGCVQ